MKITFACVFCLFTLGYCLAQSNRSISVAVLKESKKVDALMDTVLHNSNLPYKNEKGQEDSCWMIELINWKDGSVSLQMAKNSKAEINFRINKLENDKVNFGCFNYRGNNVFVTAEKNFSPLFFKTKKIRTFNFIFYSTGTNITERELYQHVLHYKFSNGLFSEELPPPIAQ